MIPIDENLSEMVANNARCVGSVNGNALYSYEVPKGSFLVVTKFGNYISVVGAWGAIEWSLRVNGIPVPPYNLILDQLGQSYEPYAIKPIIVRGGDIFEIDGFNNASGAGCDIGCRVVAELWEAR